MKYFLDGYKSCVLWPLAQHGLVLCPCEMFHAYAQLLCNSNKKGLLGNPRLGTGKSFTHQYFVGN
jgi:hypothetical protein